MIYDHNYPNIDKSIISYISEVNEKFPEKPYEIGAFKSRELFAQQAKKLPLTRNRHLEVSNHIFETSMGEVAGRIYRPSNFRNHTAALLYLHGGGWIMGDLRSHDQVCVDLSLRCKLTVIALDYALSPENKFPIALNQCFSVYLELIKNKKWLGRAASNILIGGDSAGGNLAAALSLKLRGESKALPKAQILFYPCLSLNFNSPSYLEFSDAPILDKPSMEFFWDAYLERNISTKNPLAVPMLEKDFSGIPETIICTAEVDPLTSDGFEFVKKLRNSNIAVTHIHAKGMVHGFIRFLKRSPVANYYFWLVCKKINSLLEKAN